MIKSPSNNLLLWENAVPMNRAPETFAPTELRAKWDSAYAKSATKALADRADAITDDEPRGWDLVMKVLDAPQKILIERSKIEQICQDNLLRELAAGSIQSFAFAAPRSLDASPVELAVSVWGGLIKWGSNTITHQSLTFVEVRLISAEKSKALLGAKKSLLSAKLDILPRTKRPVSGRPGVKADIEEAFHALMEAGRFDLDAPVKSQCQLIREWLIQFRPEGGFGSDKPGYDAIRRHINPLIAEEKR